MRELIAITLLASTVALAAPLKLAVVYGHNGGTQTRPALRFAENDASRVAATLVELAGIAPGDVKLLQGTPKEELEKALEWATARIAAAHKTPGAQAVLYVYLSAHGDDGRGLELGPQTLAWSDLKAKLAATKADVRVAVIDACSASGMLEAGGRAAAGFEIRAEDRLTVAGEAVITSSAANEPSLEAGAYKGSVFTHHLLAALRGAADRSADGRVSLEEAYRYAYARTVEGESGQHPGYGFKLAGHGELFVTSLKGAATVTLPRNLEAVTISDAATGDRYLEIRQPDGRTLALPPGRWEVKVWREGKASVGRLTLTAGQRITLDEKSLTAAPAATAQLVRLAASPHYCVKKIEAAPALAALATKLVKAIEVQDAHACFEGALEASLTLSRDASSKLRVTGKLGSKPIDVVADEAALAGDVGRALASAL